MAVDKIEEILKQRQSNKFPFTRAEIAIAIELKIMNDLYAFELQQKYGKSK